MQARALRVPELCDDHTSPSCLVTNSLAKPRYRSLHTLVLTECFAIWLAILSLHSLLCVILLKIRMAFVMMAVLRSKSFVGMSLKASAAWAGDLMGKPLGQTALVMALWVVRS